MSTINSAKQCGCQEIAKFYQEAMRNDPKSGIIATEIVGPLKGLFVQYIVPTANGPVKVTCENGFDTLNFNDLSIVASGFVKVTEAGTSSGGKSFSATRIGPVNSDGICNVKTIFSKATIALPSVDRK